MRIALVALVALVLAPAAAAWTPISTTPLQNTDRPAVLRTGAGTELVGWDDDNSGLWLWSSKGSAPVVATKKTVTVLDDGFGVGATLKGGGHTVKTNAAGKASLAAFKKGTRIVAGAPGYAPASFKRP